MLKKKYSRRLYLIAVIVLFVIGFGIYYFESNRADQTDNDSVSSTALVTTTTAQAGLFSPTITAYGTLSAPPELQKTLTAQGNVIIEKLAVSPYSSVKKGQRLIQFAATPDGEAALQNAERNLAHLQALQKQYLATNSDVASAAATLNSLEVQYNHLWLTAPCDGVIGAFLVNPGDTVNNGTPLLNFSPRASIGALLQVTAAEQVQIKKGDLVTLSVVDHPELQFSGTVSSIATALNTTTGLIDLDVKIPQLPPDIVVNTLLKANIATAKAQPAILLPQNAVLYQGKTAYVFIDHDNKAEYRSVTVAGGNDTEVAVSSGIQAGEQVVISGNYELQDGMALTTQGNS